MTDGHSAEKSCGSQPLGIEAPSRSWGIDRLTDYVRLQYRTIVRREGTLAAIYWRLGQGLSLARETFTHGQWGPFLLSQGIDKTRASKARSIYEAFGSAEELKGMSVADAYEARCRKLRNQESVPADLAAELPVRFNKALVKVEDDAMRVFENTTQWTRLEKQELLEALRHTIACLQEHAKQLETEIGA
jgi:hypothetical protein